MKETKTRKLGAWWHLEQMMNALAANWCGFQAVKNYSGGNWGWLALDLALTFWFSVSAIGLSEWENRPEKA